MKQEWVDNLKQLRAAQESIRLAIKFEIAQCDHINPNGKDTRHAATIYRTCWCPICREFIPVEPKP